MPGTIRPNHNQRSNGLPVDDELEAVITVNYVFDPNTGEYRPSTFGGGAGESIFLKRYTDGGLINPKEESDFARILKFEPRPGEEIRREETTTDDYHGVAPDNAPTANLVWTVVRFYKTAGKITRVRYRTGVAWDARAAGW